MGNGESDAAVSRGSVTQTQHFDYEYDHPLVARVESVFGDGRHFTWIDCAWAAMLIRQGIIPKGSAAAVARAAHEFLRDPPDGYTGFAGLENWVVDRLGQALGGSLTIGRTVPPLNQMAQVRRELLILVCVVHDVMDTLLDVAQDNLVTIMPGYTHIRHAQPTTLGHYLLSVFDPLERAMCEVENGWRLMSLNEMGCGALAGTSLPIDRDRVTEYLGLEGLIENANDAVAYSDGYVTLTAALMNLNAVFSRFALDLNFWSSEECGFLDVPWTRMHRTSRGELRLQTHTHSHFMPNKTNNCPTVERSRVAAAEVLGALTEVAAMGMRAPHADMHEMLHMADGTLRAIRTTQRYMLPYIDMLPRMTVDRQRMRDAVREGWSAATELVNRLVMDHGLDCRSAHDVLNRFIAESKDQGRTALSASVEDFNAAAQSVLARRLDLSEAELRRALDPENFVRVTDSKGGVAPAETGRMLNERRERMAQARRRHISRVDRLESAKAGLLAELERMGRQKT